MSTITITFVQHDGAERVLAGIEARGTLMEAARDNGVAGILADCGGACDCGTCHVHIDPSWVGKVGMPNDLENDTLDLMVQNRIEGRSRLSCQVALTPEFDGLRVTVATS